jgi:hypothetical protein
MTLTVCLSQWIAMILTKTFTLALQSAVIMQMMIVTALWTSQ